MELIKQIKDAETKSRQIVEQAKAEAVRIADESRKGQDVKQKEAQDLRRDAVTAAIEQAEQSGQGQVEELKQQGIQQVEQLRSQVAERMNGCVDKVMQHLKNI
ncbi:MAG: hypothetical protein KAJ07_08330 [Planctomycetes bacterium]|nr:hypothetical protein [Planctomycetota bacterium]